MPNSCTKQQQTQGEEVLALAKINLVRMREHDKEETASDTCALLIRPCDQVLPSPSVRQK